MYNRECGREETGRLLTIGTYFALRMVATMALACCFIMLDAQTIQVKLPPTNQIIRINQSNYYDQPIKLLGPTN